MFNQLYVQTEYSILQSACRLEPLFVRLREDGVSACAIVDEGTMYGTIKFYKGCLKNNIKPIIGLKVNYIYTIDVEGMSCGHCTDKVEKALSKLDGVIKVSANLKNKTATVESEIEIAEEVFDKTITEIGFVFKKVEQD